MRESAGATFNEIDSFTIPLTFPPGVQEVEFLGDNEVAAIILSADVMCIEPNICGPSLTPSEVPSGDVISNKSIINLIYSQLHIQRPNFRKQISLFSAGVQKRP